MASLLTTEVNDAACWWLTFEWGVASVMIVVMEPGGESGNAFVCDVRAQGVFECVGAVAGAVVGEDSLDGDAGGVGGSLARSQKPAAVSFFSSSRISV